MMKNALIAACLCYIALDQCWDTPLLNVGYAIVPTWQAKSVLCVAAAIVGGVGSNYLMSALRKSMLAVTIRYLKNIQAEAKGSDDVLCNSCEIVMAKLGGRP